MEGKRKKSLRRGETGAPGAACCLPLLPTAWGCERHAGLTEAPICREIGCPRARDNRAERRGSGATGHGTQSGWRRPALVAPKRAHSQTETATANT
jgi:hypothetical protein